MSDVWARFIGRVSGAGGLGMQSAADRERWDDIMSHPGLYEIAIRRAVAQRNVPQFKILNATARQIAESSGHTIEEVKAQALVSCFGDEKLRPLTVLGRTIYLPMSTNELTKDEASKVIDWLKNTAEFLGLQMMDPDTYEVMK